MGNFAILRTFCFFCQLKKIDFHDIFVAFYHLGRVIAQGIVFSAGLEYVTKTKSDDVLLLSVTRGFTIVTFLSLLWNARKLISTSKFLTPFFLEGLKLLYKI